MKKQENKEIENITFKSSNQSIGHREIYSLKARDCKIRLDLQSDSYQMQCYAKAYVFDNFSSEWKLLYSIPPTLMKTRNGLIYEVPYRNNQENAKNEFKLDVELLKQRVEEILL